MSNWDCLPVDIIINILLRLPLKSLIRLKSVSKSWLSLIESPEFVESHLQLSLKTHTNNLIIFAETNSFVCVDIEQPVDAALSLHRHPLKYDDHGAEVLGSSNGLLVLREYIKNKIVTIWNPSTRRHVNVPFTDFMRGDSMCCNSYGFGYDGNDYKLVRIENPRWASYEYESKVMIFSLKNRCWKKCENLPYNFVGHGVFVGNALNWVCAWISGSRSRSTNHKMFILNFDMGSEKYGEVPLPDFDQGYVVIHLDILQGRLVLIGKYDEYFDIWVMGDYGVKESWVKLIVLTPEITGYYHKIRYVRPLFFSKNGKDVLLESTELHEDYFLWFNLITKQARRVRLNGLPTFFNSCLFVESLVPV